MSLYHPVRNSFQAWENLKTHPEFSLTYPLVPNELSINRHRVVREHYYVVSIDGRAVWQINCATGVVSKYAKLPVLPPSQETREKLEAVVEALNKKGVTFSTENDGDIILEDPLYKLAIHTSSMMGTLHDDSYFEMELTLPFDTTGIVSLISVEAKDEYSKLYKWYLGTDGRITAGFDGSELGFTLTFVL